MEEMKKKSAADMEREICFSNAVKAGKRTYFVDVRKTHKDEMYLTITESKKNPVVGEEAATYEKHKIFLYQEDFQKFVAGLLDAMEYIKKEQGEPVPVNDRKDDLDDEIKINIEF